MSYPPPPGLKPQSASVSTPTPPAHSSLPPRPPPPAGHQPAFQKQALAPSTPSFTAGAPGTKGYGTSDASSATPTAGNRIAPGAFSFQPRAVVATSHPYRTHSPNISAPPAPPSRFSYPTTTPSYQAQPSYHQHPTPSYYQQPQPQAPSYNENSYNAQPTPPQIRNPFPLPGQDQSRNRAGPGGAGAGGGDPELEAQIAQWQSAYVSKDESNNTSRPFGSTRPRTWNQGEGVQAATGANSGPLGSGNRFDPTSGLGGPAATEPTVSSAPTATSAPVAATDANGKPKTVIRSGGGQTWSDSSLLEWDPAHFRLFVGNLAGEVTDESLLKAFSKYTSVQKARVVRDKRTTKSKGFGFISFASPDDYFHAEREMQGKYIGSHPVLLRKSNTEIKATSANTGKSGKGGKDGGKGRGGGGGVKGGGIEKKKAKGAMKVLG
ncbi:hypothetical protein MMC25_003335 [Agyrium rufum]|nr:hypothetical protein [Agyrium rufum]